MDSSPNTPQAMPNQTNKLVVEARSVHRDAEFPYFAMIAVTPALLAEAERLMRLATEHGLLEAAATWTIGWELGWSSEQDHTVTVMRESVLVAGKTGVLFRLDDSHHCLTCDIPLAVLHQAAESADPITYHGSNISELKELLAA